jgi:hypothetical protein
MRRTLLLAVVINALTGVPAGVQADGCAILIYNLWTTPGLGGYDNAHYDEDTIAILTAAGHDVLLVDRAQEPLITGALLASYDQLWLLAINNAQVKAITAGEVAAVVDFQQDGGGVAIFGEHDDFFEDINVLAAPLGGEFTGTGIDHATEIPTSGFPPHPIWQGVSSIGGASSEGDLHLIDPGFLSPIAEHNDGTMVAVHDGSGGRVLLDTSFVRLFDEAYSGAFQTWATEYDNEVYIANISHWLADCGTTPVASSTWGRLKATYRR